MNEAINLYMKENSKAGLFISVIIHAALFVCAIMLFNSSSGTVGGGGYVEISASDINTPGGSKEVVKEELPKEEVKTHKAVSEDLVEKVSSSKNSAKEEMDAVSSGKGGRYAAFSTNAGDTSSLQQVYTEKSLNVKINYPIGWTFVDQSKRSKLDGVTFWAVNGVFDPPPYVFLEVKEKYLFNPSRFKYNSKTLNSVIYYNDPEELEGQVNQIFYFRTDSGEDYSIKLIMNGREAFSAFQPVFFGMIKTFRFGKSLF